MNGVKNDRDEPLKSATVALLRGKYKQTYFFGYDELGPGVERIELYDVESAPEELSNLHPAAEELLNELKAKLDEVNRPYLST